MPRRLLLVLIVLVASAASFTAPPTSADSLGALGQPVPPKGPFAVVLVIDAARYDEIDLSRMPNLAHLMATGSSYDQAWVGHLPSVTESSHATIGTGVLPSRHLILGDTWRVPGTSQMAPNLLDENLDHTGYIGKFIQQTKVPTLAGIIHASFPGSLVAAVSGHKTYAADALGGGAADFVAFGARDNRKHFVPSAIPGHAPAAAILNSAQLDMPTYPGPPGSEDQWTTTLSEKFLFKYHPKVLMVNFPEVDTFGHVSGTSATVMQPLMSNIDKQIGRIVAAYGRAGLLPQTYFFITSDHGMVPGMHTVDIASIKNAITGAGIDPLYIGHGDFSEVWLKDPAKTPVAAAALMAANIPNVVAVYARDVRGKFGLVSNSTRSLDPFLQQAYTDLLASTQCAEAPDIILLYAENTITMTPGFVQTGRKGDHQGATWGAQHIPFVVSGPGIRQGYRSLYPARLVDLAPTLETVLGARPSGQDGVPLADSMIAPPAWAVQQQNAVAIRFTQDVAALQRAALSAP